MDMDTVLHRLGVRDDTLTHAEREQLDDRGYVALPNLIPDDLVERFRTRLKQLMEAEGEEAGKEVHQESGALRLSDLINKDPIFDFCYTHPRLLAAVRHILTIDFKVHSLNCRFALPGEGQQALHMDWGPRDDKERALARSGHYFVANSLWLLDDFTELNGPTRLVPGSHRWCKAPSEEMSDPSASHPDEIKVLAPAGTVVVFNSHIWHGGSHNESNDLRRVMHMAFVRRGLPQQTDQKQYLRPATLKRIDEARRILLDV
ncbi:MAG: phytanoyl-CoA dioxygenase [Candidatus Latescibacteria bacterium]|jgi:ectoine hydroxylase-related dioxygenase (phytanoyl-CoA dioxygenase family)|nr:phytanoyl-CoA dioxygenase [Candidatus Latescibacterota bacterium]